MDLTEWVEEDDGDPYHVILVKDAVSSCGEFFRSVAKTIWAAPVGFLVWYIDPGLSIGLSGFDVSLSTLSLLEYVAIFWTLATLRDLYSNQTTNLR
jgi:hypothetical protein